MDRKPIWMIKYDEYKNCPKSEVRVKCDEYYASVKKFRIDESKLNGRLISASHQLQRLERKRYTDAEDTTGWGAPTNRYDSEIKQLRREIALLQIEAYENCFKISKKAYYALDENPRSI